MRWRLLFTVCGMTMIATNMGHAQSPATKMAPAKGWLTDLAAAKTRAQQTGKPLMVVFRCDP